MASIIKNPDYRWWLLGDALAQLASGIQLFALPLYAVTVAGSVALGGITATIGLVAMAVCALPEACSPTASTGGFYWFGKALPGLSSVRRSWWQNGLV